MAASQRRPASGHGKTTRGSPTEELAVQLTSPTASPPRSSHTAHPVRFAVVVGALGVVFGDIGTSPIYTVQTVFNPESVPHPVPVSTDSVYGIISFFFWSVTIIVTLTYYVPSINAILMVGVLVLVFAFRSSAALAYAFGMAVIATITITTVLFLYIARTRWRTPLWLVLIGGGTCPRTAP